MNLVSARERAPSDPSAFYGWALDRGWSDGLPLIPPTDERVAAMVAGSHRRPEELVATLDPRSGLATVEKIAVNAVMAGCLPAYMPILLAAIEALADPKLNLAGVQCTINPAGPALLINGPVRKDIDIAFGPDALGPGHRANQTIGRAVRLCMRNIGGGFPPTDCAVYGSPWKMGLVLGENEEQSPWEPLHVEKGFAREQSVATLLNVESVINVIASYTTAEAVVTMLARAMGNGLNVHHSNGTLVHCLSLGHAKMLAEAGYTKQRLKETLFERAKVPLKDLPAEGNQPSSHWVVEDDKVLVTRTPGDIEVVVAGADKRGHSIYLAGWGISKSASRATR